MTATREKIVETTECMEKSYSGEGPGPTAELLDTIGHARKRFEQLASILETAEARQVCAAAVVELRFGEALS
jgi:hypothetical protein